MWLVCCASGGKKAEKVWQISLQHNGQRVDDSDIPEGSFLAANKLNLRFKYMNYK